MTSRRSGTFPSPGTPNYRHASVVMQKGWSSERVPLHTNAGRKHANSALLPFSNGRTLPSKWEDAERWIFSPVSGDGVNRTSVQQPQRKPKSKSGPLGPPGIAYYSLYSPTVQMFDGASVSNFTAGSPFSAGVIAADGLAIRPSGHGGAFNVRTEPCMARSVSVHGCSETPNHSSYPANEGTSLCPFGSFSWLNIRICSSFDFPLDRHLALVFMNLVFGHGFLYLPLDAFFHYLIFLIWELLH